MASMGPLELVDSVLADVRVTTTIVYKWTQEISQRLPLLRLLQATSSSVFEQLGQPGIDSIKLLKNDKDVWALIYDGNAAQHLESLLAAHQLLLAVSDMCQQASNALMAVHAAMQSLLVSSGREVLTSFMTLLCDTARLALLLNDVPRRQLPPLIHACHHVVMLSSEAVVVERQGAPGPLPSTDLPIYHMANMVQFLQHVLRPLTPRVQQVLELSLAPALTSLFTPGSSSSSASDSTTNTTNTPSAAAQTCIASLPPIFHLHPTPSSDRDSPDGMTANNKTVIMGPGGMQMHSAHALCMRFEALTSWVLFGYLVCPVALLHSGSVQLLTQLLRTEVYLVLHKDRCCSIGALYEEALAPATEVPQYSGSHASGGLYTSGLQYSRQHSRALREAQAAVQRAMRWAAAHAAGQQQLLRLECIQAVQTAVAACKADPSLLSSNLVMLLALLSMSRYAVLWFFRHSDNPNSQHHQDPSHPTSTGSTSSAPHPGPASDDPPAATRRPATDGGTGPAPAAPAPRPKQPRGSNRGIALSKGGPVGRPGPSTPHDQDPSWDCPEVLAGSAHGRRSGSTLTFTGGLAGGVRAGPGQQGGGSSAGQQVVERRLSALELMDVMQQLVSLMDDHMEQVREHLRDHVSQLMKRHVTPGHMRLLTSGLPTSLRTTTLSDVQRLVSIINQLMHASAAPDPPPHAPAALAYAWRLAQLHTVAQPAAAAGEGVSAPGSHTAGVAPAPAELNVHGGVLGLAAGAAGAEVAQQGGGNPTSTLHINAGGVAAVAASGTGQDPHGGGGGDAGLAASAAAPQRQALTGGQAAPQAHGGALGPVGSACDAGGGLAAPQVAAVTQDPLFLSALQEVVEMLCWRADPAHMLRSQAGLRAVVHAPSELHRCVTVALAHPATAHLAVAAVRSLHWMTDTTAPALRRSGPRHSWRLATQLMDRITLYLRDCMAPLLLPSTPASTPTDPRAVSNGGWSAPHLDPSAHVVANMLPLCVALSEAGVIQVTPDQAIVPVEYARQVVHDCVESLLGDLAREVPQGYGGGGGGGGVQGGGGKGGGVQRATAASGVAIKQTEDAWRPAAALQRVRVLLRVASHLQPLLGPDTQLDLQAILFSGPTTSTTSTTSEGPKSPAGGRRVSAGGQGGPDAPQAAPVQREQRPAVWDYLQAVVNWYTTHVLEDSSAPGCCYSPILDAFIAPLAPGAPASAAAGQPATSGSGGGGSKTGSDNGVTGQLPLATAAATAPALGTLARLKHKLRDATHPDQAAVAQPHHPHALAVQPAQLTDPGTGGPRFNKDGGPRLLPGGGPRDGVGGAECVVLLSGVDLMAMLELCGPEAIQTLTSSCARLLEQGCALLDAQLQARQPSLALLLDMLTSSPLPTLFTTAPRNPTPPSTQGPSGAPYAVPPNPALLAHVGSLVAAKQGLHSPYEMGKVQVTVQLLARCLGLRRMLAAATQQAAQRHSPDWVQCLGQLQLPQGAQQAACQAPPPGARCPPLPPQLLASEAGGAVDWASCVQVVSDVAAQAQDQGAGRGLSAAMPAPHNLAYNDMWPLPRPSQAPRADTFTQAPVDPLLVQLLAGKIRSPTDCARWALLPALLGLCTAVASPGARGGAPSLPPSSSQELRVTSQDSNLMVLSCLTAAWQAAASQALHSPATLDAVLPVCEAHGHFLAVSTLAAEARSQLAAAHLDWDMGARTGSGAAQQAAGPFPLVAGAQHTWSAALAAAIRGC